MRKTTKILATAALTAASMTGLAVSAHADVCRRTGAASFDFNYKVNVCVRDAPDAFGAAAGYAVYSNGSTDVRMYVELGYGPASGGPVRWEDFTTTPYPGTLTTRFPAGSPTFSGFATSGRDLAFYDLATHQYWCVYARTWMTDNGLPHNEAESGPLCGY